MLNGVNPTAMTRCVELPEEMKNAEEQIFGDKTTCGKEIQVGWILFYKRKYTYTDRVKTKLISVFTTR